MLTAKRAFSRNAASAPPLPRVPALGTMYDHGIVPRQGDLIMVAGRSGSQKSGFVQFWTAMMGLPTLYFSGDMTPYEATARLVSINTQMTTDAIDDLAKEKGGIQGMSSDLVIGSNIDFVSRSPITFDSIGRECQAYVEQHNAFPSIIVVDNLMDVRVDGMDGEYQEQREVMNNLTKLSRSTGSTVIVTHHAREIDDSAPDVPPSRNSLKNKVTEKPQLILGVSLYGGGVPDSRGQVMPPKFRVVALKQRQGRSDPSGQDWVQLAAFPEYTWFGPDKMEEPWKEFL